MDFPGVGHGQNDFFVFQARAFLEQVAGLDRLPPCPRLAERPAQPPRADASPRPPGSAGRPSRPRDRPAAPTHVRTRSSHERTQP